MAPSAGKVERSLREAWKTGTPVTVERGRLTGTTGIDGFVDQVTAGWVVIAGLDDTVYPDGFEIVRRRDISKVVPVSPARAAFVGRALGSLGRKQAVCPFTVAEGSTTRDVLEVVAANTPMFGFCIEREDPGVLFIGRISHLRKKSFDFLFIDADGRWKDSAGRWKYKQLSRLTFGNRYQRALEKFGDPVPASRD